MPDAPTTPRRRNHHGSFLIQIPCKTSLPSLPFTSKIEEQLFHKHMELQERWLNVFLTNYFQQEPINNKPSHNYFK